MRRLRTTLHSHTGNKPCMRNGTAYLMILNAVNEQRGLIHGRLDGAHGEHCAIGSYFDINNQTCLPTELIDEVAAVNDSVPHATPRQRRLVVARWLRWKLAQAGMPGFKQSGTPTEAK